MKPMAAVSTVKPMAAVSTMEHRAAVSTMEPKAANCYNVYREWQTALDPSFWDQKSTD